MREKVFKLQYMTPSLIMALCQIPRTVHHAPHCWSTGEIILFPLACMGVHAAILDVIAMIEEHKERKAAFEHRKAETQRKITEVEHDFDKISLQKGSDDSWLFGGDDT